MAFFTLILLVVSLLLATSSAAPKSTNLGITIPKDCEGKDFCSIRPEGYDEIEKKINAILPPYLINIGSRMGPTNKATFDDDDNCPSNTTEESVYTYHANQKSMDIFVQTDKFPQKIVKKTCVYDMNKEQIRRLKENRPQCFGDMGLGNFNLEFSCQQHTATQTLLVYDNEKNILKTKNYTIPVCCSCKITRK